MSDFRELSPDPFTPFTPPGDAGWRDWFLRLGGFLRDLVKTPAGYSLTTGRMAVAVDGSLLADSDAITVIGTTPIFQAGLVDDLPDPADVPYGRRFVTDSNSVVFADVVANGGAFVVPVYSDGTDWRIG